MENSMETETLWKTAPACMMIDGALAGVVDIINNGLSVRFPSGAFQCALDLPQGPGWILSEINGRIYIYPGPHTFRIEIFETEPTCPPGSDTLKKSSGTITVFAGAPGDYEINWDLTDLTLDGSKLYYVKFFQLTATGQVDYDLWGFTYTKRTL